MDAFFDVILMNFIFSTEKFIIMNYLTPGVLSMAIEKDLAMIFVKLVDTYAPGMFFLLYKYAWIMLTLFW